MERLEGRESITQHIGGKKRQQVLVKKFTEVWKPPSWAINR